MAKSRITGSLYAGLQLILPGEVAPCHRHAASALRFVIEGTGAYTAVEGERTTMHPGDFILTPSWTYHDHGNQGGAPTVWLDGLEKAKLGMTTLAEVSRVVAIQQTDTEIAGTIGGDEDKAPARSAA